MATIFLDYVTEKCLSAIERDEWHRFANAAILTALKKEDNFMQESNNCIFNKSKNIPETEMPELNILEDNNNGNKRYWCPKCNRFHNTKNSKMGIEHLQFRIKKMEFGVETSMQNDEASDEHGNNMESKNELNDNENRLDDNEINVKHTQRLEDFHIASDADGNPEIEISNDIQEKVEKTLKNKNVHVLEVITTEAKEMDMKIIPVERTNIPVKDDEKIPNPKPHVKQKIKQRNVYLASGMIDESFSYRIHQTVNYKGDILGTGFVMEPKRESTRYWCSLCRCLHNRKSHTGKRHLAYEELMEKEVKKLN